MYRSVGCHIVLVIPTAPNLLGVTLVDGSFKSATADTIAS